MDTQLPFDAVRRHLLPERQQAGIVYEHIDPWPARAQLFRTPADIGEGGEVKFDQFQLYAR
jgi:hypothetical protein